MNQAPNNLSDLTQSQLWIWTGQQLSPNVPLYNVVFTFELSGEINVSRFRTAFQILIDKSDSMRTVFERVDDIPQRKLLDSIPYEVEFLDLSKEREADEQFRIWLDQRMKKNFDLSKPLFDSVLIKVQDDRFIWFFNQHHLICDAWGVSVQYKALTSIYERLTAGKTTADIQIPRFQKYVEYERTNRLNLQNSAVKTYWEEKLKSAPPDLRLYGKTVEENTTLSSRVSIDLGSRRTEKLLEIAKEKDFRLLNLQLTLFNVFATILYAYLSRVSNEQNDLTLGTPVHNRSTPDFKETPGLFIEFFPFVNEVKNEDTFISLFKRVGTRSYDFLRSAQPGAGTPNLNRAYNIILNYINTDFPDFNGIPCEAIWRHPHHSDSSHHLRLHIYNDAASDNIKLYFDLNRAVFSEKMLGTAPDHFLRLFDAFLENPDQSIGKASVLSEAEFQQIVVDFNERTEVANENVLELFQSQVRNHPQKIAVSDKSQNLSYADLDEKSDQLANYLIANGIAGGQRIAIYLNRSADLIVAILGAFKAGCAYVPIATNNPHGRVVERIRQSQAAIVLTNANLADGLPDLQIALLRIDADRHRITQQEPTKPKTTILPQDLAYVMFTSGSTGSPKGVQISHRALANYINWAGKTYEITIQTTFPLFTTIDFDLTVTSIFVPLTMGSSIVVYEESETGPDLALFDVIEDNKADVIKLTPSHLTLIKDRDLKNSRLGTMIVGGEDLKRDLAENIAQCFPNGLKIYNEYGPTEATVGCIWHRFDSRNDLSRSVPIGRPITNTHAFILDENLNPIPQGVVGKLYLSGESLADGYWNNKELTEQKFLPNPFKPDTKIYETGDFARLNSKGEIEYLGRQDQQVKVGGIRVELGEIESAIAKHPGIVDCVVELVDGRNPVSVESITNCLRCGLPSNYPATEFDENGVCNHCLSFENYRGNAEKYFKTPADLQKLFDGSKAEKRGEYDCLMLLSGGKDSTYALAQLVGMGVRVLAYTLDNGYISDEAKANIERVVNDLGVEHIFGKTPAMNEIFVDSLQTYSNVCNGCFKTIYTLSTKVALEKKIPFIVTGLSRGQFFETRLTEELFRKDAAETIDKTVLEARKSYHRVDDAVKRLLDTSIFEEDSVFEKVQFIDFYRYFEVEYEAMMNYLNEHLPWIRPTDTGRSTNCLINQVGIYVHKKERGYSNYAYPYSWDVRMGHKTREVSLDEINEKIDENEVKRILGEIGYSSKNVDRDKNLVAFYTAQTEIPDADLRNHLKNHLPDYMMPAYFKCMESLPLTDNGKVDRKVLRNLADISKNKNTDYVSPETEFEKIISGIWSEVLQMEKIGIHDNFLELGGNSLAAIRIATRVNDFFDLNLPLNTIFEMPTVSRLCEHIEKSILTMLEESDA